MRRRTFLGMSAGVLSTVFGGCLGTAPRATGPRNPPEAPAGQPRQTPPPPDLVVGTFDFEATDAGALRVFGTVGNRSDVQRTAMVTVTADVGGEQFQTQTSVTVDADSTAEWSVTFDVGYERFVSNGSLSVDVG
ncbi:MAG: transcriptional initiation protein Tat [Halobellus sp.]|uniref:transcriptional initiation protein Tat n=1 Tax=Halobellus sp. TaxID=1979212 RepID=UPI0035D421AA